MSAILMKGKDIVVHKWLGVLGALLIFTFGAGGTWAVLDNRIAGNEKAIEMNRVSFKETLEAHLEAFERHLARDQEFKLELTERLSRIEGLLEATLQTQTGNPGE